MGHSSNPFEQRCVGEQFAVPEYRPTPASIPLSFIDHLFHHDFVRTMD
jgi:hypothetical protein